MKIPGPVFTEGNVCGCRHDEDSYIGSIAITFNEYRDAYNIYDVYYYGTVDRKEVCLRYGSENYQYISPGDLETASKSKDRAYIEAFAMIISRLHQNGELT